MPNGEHTRSITSSLRSSASVTELEDPPRAKTPGTESAFRLAVRALVVSGTALTMGKVASTRLNPGGDGTQFVLFAAVALGLTVAAGMLTDPVRGYVHRFLHRRGS